MISLKSPRGQWVKYVLWFIYNTAPGTVDVLICSRRNSSMMIALFFSRGYQIWWLQDYWHRDFDLSIIYCQSSYAHVDEVEGIFCKLEVLSSLCLCRYHTVWNIIPYFRVYIGNLKYIFCFHSATVCSLHTTFWMTLLAIGLLCWPRRSGHLPMSYTWRVRKLSFLDDFIRLSAFLADIYHR